ncbi:MAG: hypothetical protein V3W44_10575 [Dehalococcoidales bacterium]
MGDKTPTSDIILTPGPTWSPQNHPSNTSDRSQQSNRPIVIPTKAGIQKTHTKPAPAKPTGLKKQTYNKTTDVLTLEVA